jgi:hypothetical protein
MGRPSGRNPMTDYDRKSVPTGARRKPQAGGAFAPATAAEPGPHSREVAAGDLYRRRCCQALARAGAWPILRQLASRPASPAELMARASESNGRRPEGLLAELHELDLVSDPAEHLVSLTDRGKFAWYGWRGLEPPGPR